MLCTVLGLGAGLEAEPPAAPVPLGPARTAVLWDRRDAERAGGGSGSPAPRVSPLGQAFVVTGAWESWD